MKDVFAKYHGCAKVFFIDDWLSMLHEAKKTDPSVFTIWIKRGEYAQAQEEQSDFQPDAIVENIRDVIPLVK